jgi:hypothetical protein
MTNLQGGPMSAAARIDRDEVFLEMTRSVCPVCKQVLEAELNARAGQVFLRKRCPDHGPFEARVYGDADMYMEALRFNKPGTIPLETQTEIRDGCPLDCGLCPDHRQHACLGVIEVNSSCNLDCPICFADSGHQPDAFSLTDEQVERALDAFVRAEGEPEVVMFSGGEPSIHPRILQLLALARSRPIRHVVLNTNGIRLARDPSFAPALAKLGVAVYLQFDGVRRETHERLRGRDLREEKERALDACADAGLSVALVAAVERGVNEHEVGDVLRAGLAHPAVVSVVYQPVTHAGRHLEFDPRTRLTNSDVIHGVVEQTGGALDASDFFPVPCCFPTCRSVTYLLVDGPDVVPIPRVLRVEDHLDYVTNRVLPDPAIREALEKLWSASAVAGSGTVADQLACATCRIELPPRMREATSKAFMVVIQDFQDAYTLNVKQLKKCCVEQLTPDGRLIPFCAYNSVGYREEVRASLTGVPVDDVVPNARELLPIIRVGPHGSMVVAGQDAGEQGDPTERGG